jgi:hypothetical protein
MTAAERKLAMAERAPERVLCMELVRASSVTPTNWGTAIAARIPSTMTTASTSRRLNADPDRLSRARMADPGVSDSP